MSETTYWAAERETKKLIDSCLRQFSKHLGAMRQTGRLERAFRSVNVYYGHGTDGWRDSSQQTDDDDDSITETHVNKIRPAIQNALSIICGTRPALKPKARNSDAIPVAQTRLATLLIETFDERQEIEQLQLELAQGGLVASSWWAVDSWLPNKGAPYAVDASGNLVYEGDLETILLPPWRIAADPVAQRPNLRRWVLFKRKEPLHDLAATAEEKGRIDIAEKLRGLTKTGGQTNAWISDVMSGLTQGAAAATGDDIDPTEAVWVWELRHLDSPALRGGRQVRFVEPDIVLFDSWAVPMGGAAPVQDEETGEFVGENPETRAVPYPYEGLHAQEFCPERMLGSTHGHTPAFDLQALQDFHDVCTTSISTTVDRLGLPHLHSPPNSVPKPRQLARGITVLEAPIAPVLIDFPALKPEVLEAAKWANTEINLGLALNDTVMGNPPKGMPASAQALQRAQAVQFNQGAQKAWVKAIGASATSRLGILKRFAKTQAISQIAGAAGAWESEAWASEKLGTLDGFDVDEVNPISDTFEGRQAMAEMLGLDADALYDFLTTGSLPLAMKDKQAAHEYAEKLGDDLENGMTLAPVAPPDPMNPAAEPQFLDDGQKHITLSRTDPLHLVLRKAAAVMRSAKTTGQAEVLQAAGDVCTLAFQFWASLTPDELFAYDIPPLPSHQMMAAAPPAVQDEQTGEPVEGMTSAKTPDESPALPKPPPNPIDGQSADATSLNLGEMNA